MPSKPAKPRSIAAQLILLFTLASAILFGCALGGFYWLVIRHAFSEDNAVLTDKLRALQAELREPGGLKTVDQELNSGRRRTEPAVYWVRILDQNSQVVGETSGMKKLVPIAAFPATQTSSSKPFDYRVGDRLFSLASAQEPVDGTAYTIQLAQDRSEDDQFRRTFGLLLVLTLVVGTFAFAAIATTVTREGLRPLREMTHLVSRVGPRHLNERLSRRTWPREIQPLAVAFDDMLTRLEEGFVRLSQFSADLAHELRTPVANLLGEAQVALTRERPSNQYREIIESSVAECEHLSELIDNLLFLARADAAEGHIQRTQFDARGAVAKIMAIYESVIEEKQLKTGLEGTGQVYADTMLFERAVNNLIDNAVRYTPPGGSIGIAIDSNAAATQITVADTGCGIAPEHRTHVFDRFYRADRSRNSEGVGLGLSLVKSIMDLHGGAVAIESELGHGTKVRIDFPKKTEINGNRAT